VHADDELDELIDRALARYVEAEPVAGLGDRVLQRVRAADRHIGGRWAWWAVPSAALLGAVALIHIWNGRVPVKTEAVQADKGASAVILPVSVPPRWSFDARWHSRARRASHLPKLENFPARTPMTEEERALVRLVSQSPNQAVRLFSQDERNPMEPIKIEPIQIEPLETGNANTNELGAKGATD
jgi:hypothetical protein